MSDEYTRQLDELLGLNVHEEPGLPRGSAVILGTPPRHCDQCGAKLTIYSDGCLWCQRGHSKPYPVAVIRGIQT